MSSTAVKNEDIGYIYMIYNKINDLVYIGQTNNWKRRKEQHWRNAMDGTPGVLYEDMREYGIKNFKFKVIDAGPVDKLNDLETHWIAEYDSFNNGYNSTPGGNAWRVESTEPILEYDLNGVFLQEYNSISSAANSLELTSVTSIKQALDKKGHQAQGRIWRSKKSSRYPLKITGIEEFCPGKENRKYDVTRKLFITMMDKDATRGEIKEVLKRCKKAYTFNYFLEQSRKRGDSMSKKFINYEPRVVVIRKNKIYRTTLNKASKFIGTSYNHCCRVLRQDLSSRRINNCKLYREFEYEKYLKYKNNILAKKERRILIKI